MTVVLLLLLLCYPLACFLAYRAGQRAGRASVKRLKEQLREGSRCGYCDQATCSHVGG